MQARRKYFSSKDKNAKKLSSKEQRILEQARIAWGKTLKEFYYPPLNEPNFVFDYTNLEGFYINPENKWQITMNLANAPLFKDNKNYIDYFHAISLHEVSHYEVIPYDGLIHAKLLHSAMKKINQHFAPIVVNIFADLVVDTLLYRKYPKLMKWEIKETYQHLKDTHKEGISDFSQFLFKAYEKMWNESLFKDMNIPQMEELAEKVVNVMGQDFEDEQTWEAKVTKIAHYLSDLVMDTFSLIGGAAKCKAGHTKRKSPDGQVSMDMPEDVVEVMDNPLEAKNGDKLKKDSDEEKQRKAEEFAKDVPYSEFGAPAGQAGILIDGNPLATWYRGIAKGLIEINIFEERPGGQLPVSIETWRIGDPMEELDIVQTLLTCPVIIPNITTRKWTYKEGPGHLIEKQLPDLLIVLDSSGSMDWNYTAKYPSQRGAYHTALVASFAALHYAASKGVKFSVINFSNQANTCQWTTDYEKAERQLLRYQGGGTHLPTKKIIEQCNKAERKTLVFIITDFGIYNWGASKKAMINLVNQGHKIVGFFIGSPSIPKKRFKDLMDKVTLYPIKSQKDLINLVIEEVKRYYAS